MLEIQGLFAVGISMGVFSNDQIVCITLHKIRHAPFSHNVRTCDVEIGKNAQTGSYHKPASWRDPLTGF